MQNGQELTHSVTTTVTPTHQKILNETRLTQDGEVVLETTHKVNIPLGTVYDLTMQGDVNAATVQRTLAVVNRLIGQDVFSFTAINESTDPSLMPFTAQYDPQTMTFSGTAFYESKVRIIFEDGTSKLIQPQGDSTWTATISELDLQFGDNQIVLINGVQDSEIITISINREMPVEPFKPEITAAIDRAGQTISGTASDSRATIAIKLNNVMVAEVTPKADLSWSYNFAPVLAHGVLITVESKFNDQTQYMLDMDFHKSTAELDQKAGQNASGYASPQLEILVQTDKYGTQATYADMDGNWSVDFASGLPKNAVVIVSIDGIELAPITYTGPANVEYKLTLSIDSANRISGTAKPDTLLSITVANEPTFTLITDESGLWSNDLSTALKYGDKVSIVTPIGESVEQIYNVPEDPQQLTATILNNQTIIGNDPDLQSSIWAVIDGVQYFGEYGSDGNWMIEVSAGIPNMKSFYVTNGVSTVNLRNMYLEANAVTTTQIDGLGVIGSTVSIGNLQTVVSPVGAWTIILDTPLKVGDSFVVTSGEESITVAYVPPFTAYLKTDGLTVFGTSPAESVKIGSFDGTVDATVTVTDGEYSYQLPTKLNVGGEILVTSDIETKTLVYQDTVTEFSAAISATLDSVSGELSSPAKIRIVFDDNTMLERDYASGPYLIDLGRTLAVGEVIVVACISDGTMYDAKTIYAEAE